MRKKTIEDVKNSKYFTAWDIVPYVVVLAVAVVLLLVFLLPGKEQMTGFYVECAGARVMDYDFSTDEFATDEGFDEEIEIIPENGGYTVRIGTEEGYNVFFVDKEKRTVKMVDADCSFSQDCTYMPAMEKSGDSIICAPHKLKIVAFGDEVSSPVTG